MFFRQLSAKWCKTVQMLKTTCFPKSDHLYVLNDSQNKKPQNRLFFFPRPALVSRVVFVPPKPGKPKHRNSMKFSVLARQKDRFGAPFLGAPKRTFWRAKSMQIHANPCKSMQFFLAPIWLKPNQSFLEAKMLYRYSFLYGYVVFYVSTVL